MRGSGDHHSCWLSLYDCWGRRWRRRWLGRGVSGSGVVYCYWSGSSINWRWRRCGFGWPINLMENQLFLI